VGIIANLIMGYGLGGARIGSLFFGWACVYLIFMIGYFIWGAMVHLGSKIVGGSAGYDGSFRAAAIGSSPVALMWVVCLALQPVMMPKASEIEELEDSRVPAIVQPAATRHQYAYAGPLAQANPGFLLQSGPSGPVGGVPSSGDRSAAAQAILSRILAQFGLMVVLMLLGWVWSLVVTGVGIANIHSVGAGQAVGAVLIAVVLWILVLVGIMFALGAALASVFGALSSRLGR
jgi:hypothetical protein